MSATTLAPRQGVPCCKELPMSKQKQPSSPPANQPAPPKLTRKPGAFQSASGLLGRAGSGGFTAPLTPPKVPTAADMPQDEEKTATKIKPTGQGPAKTSSK